MSSDGIPLPFTKNAWAAVEGDGKHEKARRGID
jgi:hypothetical protein